MSSPSSIASSSGGRLYRAAARISPGRSSAPTLQNLGPLPSSSEPLRFQNKDRHGRDTRSHNKPYDDGIRHPDLGTSGTQDLNREGNNTNNLARSPTYGRPPPPTYTNSHITTTTATSTRNYNFKHRGNNNPRKQLGRHNNISNNNYYTNHAQSRSTRFKASGMKKSYYGSHQTPQRSVIYPTLDPPKAREFVPNHSYRDQRPSWDHYTNLSIDDLDRAKDLVLDLLGWGVETEYLLDCGISAQLIYRVFTDLNLRIPHNFVPPT